MCPLKLVIYNLPPTLKEVAFWDSVKKYMPAFGYKYYCPGMIGFATISEFHNPSNHLLFSTLSLSFFYNFWCRARTKVPSRAYVTLESMPDVQAFREEIQGKQYTAEGSGEWKGFYFFCGYSMIDLIHLASITSKATVEIAPNQLLPEPPKPHHRDLLRQGTLLQGLCTLYSLTVWSSFQ